MDNKNEQITTNWLTERFSKDGKVKISGGRELEILMIFDQPPIISIKIDGVWICDLNYTHEFELFYKMTTGKDLVTFEQYRLDKPLAKLKEMTGIKNE